MFKLDQCCVWLLLLATTICVAEGLELFERNRRNSYTWGARADTDILLADVIINEPKQLLQTVTNTYSYTRPVLVPVRTISYVRVTDLTQKRGTSVTLDSGGPTFTSVSLTFTSQRSKPIKARVEIYGPAP